MNTHGLYVNEIKANCGCDLYQVFLQNGLRLVSLVV